jgi:NAD(P)-dependent dehydrogenase (short-subunit alcohol dehydrogenase family)
MRYGGKDMKLEGKVALITGGGTGIGMAVVDISGAAISSVGAKQGV